MTTEQFRVKADLPPISPQDSDAGVAEGKNEARRVSVTHGSTVAARGTEGCFHF